MKRGYLKTKEPILNENKNEKIDVKGKGKPKEEPQVATELEPKKKTKATFPVITVSNPQFVFHALVDPNHVPNIPDSDAFERLQVPLPKALKIKNKFLPASLTGTTEMGGQMFAVRNIPAGSIIFVEPLALLAPISLKRRCLEMFPALCSRLDESSINEFSRLDPLFTAAEVVGTETNQAKDSYEEDQEMSDVEKINAGDNANEMEPATNVITTATEPEPAPKPDTYEGWSSEARIFHKNAIVIKADELETSLLPGESPQPFYMAIFLEYVPHVRHSSDPNTDYHFNSKSFAIVFTTRRFITQGEEITMSRISPLPSLASCQKAMAKKAGAKQHEEAADQMQVDSERTPEDA